jgi:hypothetical protein
MTSLTNWERNKRKMIETAAAATITLDIIERPRNELNIMATPNTYNRKYSCLSMSNPIMETS